MDDLNPPARPGGTVVPTDRAVPRQRDPRTRDDPPGTRYELRDPLAEVTWRTDSFDAMVGRAEQLGSTRFTAIDAEGQRTAVRKQGDAWPLPAPARREDPVAPAPAADRAGARPEADREREALLRRLDAALHERYVVRRAAMTLGDVPLGQTEYRYRGDVQRVAFTESAFRLATDNNSPSVARSMVDVAQARGWKALRVSGHEDFRRLVWLEASVRGVRTLGYEPVPGDREALQRLRDARQVNRIEPAPDAAGRPNAGAVTGSDSARAAGRGSGGRKAVLAALEAVLVARRVPAHQREAVMTAAAEQLARRTAAGQTHKVRVYDKAAPSQRTVPTPTREIARARDRAAPVR